jgi:acetolactate synthase-1/3 small subunit
MKPSQSLQRELLLAKVANTPKSVELTKKFGAKFIEANGVLEIEAVGERAQIEKFLTELKAVGIKELVQSGVVAMEKGATTLADRTLTTMGTANQSNQDNSTADYQN